MSSGRTPSNVRLYIDFDGTIARNDVGNEFFRAHNAFEPAHTELISGAITVPEFYKRACARLPAGLSGQDIAAFAAGQELDDGLVPLVTWCKQHNIEVRVVSDGFENYIVPMLTRVGLADLPIHANVLDEQRLTPGFPNATESCRCFCASCKRNTVITHAAADDVLVYIGDGLSDTCAASHCDVIFAKHELAAFCNAERLPHHPWKRLSDVQRILDQYHRTNGFRQRRQAVLARKRAIEAE